MSMTSRARAAVRSGRRTATSAHGLRAAARRHALFLGVLGIGAALRVVTQLAYWPALLFEDSYRYLDNVDELDPGNPRPLGYPIFLRLLLPLPDLAAVPITQHLLGLGMGVLVYALLLRWGAWRWLAALAAVPVLWDAYQLQIEHMILSDVLFQALVLGSLALLAWRGRPTVLTAALVGLLLGFSVYVRLVGQPLVIAAVLFVLLVGGGWRRRVSAAMILVVTFALPVFGYMAWYNHHYGEYKLSDMGPLIQYARVARFVDCDQLSSLPAYERPLCPGKPPAQRLPPNGFVWSAQSPARQYVPPPGMEKDEVITDFVRRVVVHQPVDFLSAWMHDFIRGFYPRKTTHPPEVPVDFWQFPTHFRGWQNDRDAGATARAYGSSGAHINEPLASFLRSYQLTAGYTPGTVLGVMLVVGVLASLGVGRARRSGMRAVCFLFASSGGGLLLAAATYEFSWRYQLPGLVLLPVAGALGIVALVRGGPPTPPESRRPVRGKEPEHQVLASSTRAG